MSPAPVNDTANVATNLVVKLEQMLLEMDRMLRQTDVASITMLPPNHSLFLLIRQTPEMISQNATPLPSVMKFVEKVVYMLYESQTAFHREFYVVFLQTLLNISPEVANEALAWLLYSDDHVRKRQVSPPHK
jgi:CCR4-NOT transcription complex subunit 1